MIFRFLFFIALLSISILAVLPDYNALPSALSYSDLVNHFIAFTVLYLLYAFAFPSHSHQRIVLTLLLYAVLIEIVQSFLPTRSASIADILADSFGILLAFFIIEKSPISTLFKEKHL